MSPNGSQAPGAFDVDRLIVTVSKAVRYACRLYDYQSNRDEVEDLSQDILVTLFNDEGRVLQSFANRSLVETWL